MSEVYYIERDGNGVIVAVYGVPQPGITDPEPLLDTHPEIVEFFNPPPTLNDYRRAVQAHVDVTAQERQYDNATSCASYVNSTNPVWAAEATAFVAWRDAVWAYAFTELDKVTNGERQQPTVSEFIDELIVAFPMVWPE